MFNDEYDYYAILAQYKSTFITRGKFETLDCSKMTYRLFPKNAINLDHGETVCRCVSA